MKVLTTIIASTLILVSTTSQAEDNFIYDYATVLQSKPIYRIIEVTKNQQQCRQQEVVYRDKTKSSGKSSLIGGILGAAVGHAIGSRSKHRSGATIAGALIGASVADSGNGRTTERRVIENNCQLVPTSWEEERLIGYDVAYRYNGKTFETRLPFEPGNSLKIRVLISPIDDSATRSD